MNDKAQIISTIKDEFGRWEDLLAGMSEEQVNVPLVPSTLSVKDVLAHLMAWQQRSIARLEAARLDREPVFPGWPADLDPEAEDVDQVNAWIYQANHEQSWSDVHRAWRDGYLRFLALGEAIPDKVLLQVGRYPWLAEYALSMVLLASYEHHEEHRDALLVWLREHGDMKGAATDPDLKKQLSELFAETGREHHKAFIATDGDDPDWPAWYAGYLQPRLGALLHRSFSVDELTKLMHALEAEGAAHPSERPWPQVYADALLLRVRSS